MGSLALIVTVYYTFLPCFLYIFVGGPLIEKSHGSQVISGILKFVTAAVVGVILNLTLFLGKDIIFQNKASLQHMNFVSLGWIILSLFLMTKLKLNVMYLIFLSLFAGLMRYWCGV
jgi:chromate transporter